MQLQDMYGNTIIMKGIRIIRVGYLGTKLLLYHTSVVSM